MRAVALMGPGKVELIDVPPPLCGEEDVLLRVEMVGLCGTDLNSFRGRNPLVSYPRIIGHEVSATVVKGTPDLVCGTHVTVSPYSECGQCASCRRGRQNACQHNQTLGVQRDGALTEFLAVPASRVYPSSLPLRDLCLVEPLTVGAHAVGRGKVTSADTVAVFGCGGVGLGAIAGAAFRGARTVALDLDDGKLEIARAAGATDLVNTAREDYRQRLRELNDGRGPDVVIEAIGLAETFRAAVEEVAFTGRVVYIGYAKEPICYETKLFVQKELTITGSRNAQPENFREVIALLESGGFPVEAAISATVSMADAPHILAEWSANPAAFTKIIVQTETAPE